MLIRHQFDALKADCNDAFLSHFAAFLGEKVIHVVRSNENSQYRQIKNELFSARSSNVPAGRTLYRPHRMALDLCRNHVRAWHIRDRQHWGTLGLDFLLARQPILCQGSG